MPASEGLIIPDRLRKGDTIGVFTASDPIEGQTTTYVQAGIRRLHDMGFTVVAGETLAKKDYYTAGTPQERWTDFERLLTDRRVKMVLTAMGGHNAHQILPYLDFEMIT